jgi:hypothetical protein
MLRNGDLIILKNNINYNRDILQKGDIYIYDGNTDDFYGLSFDTSIGTVSIKTNIFKILNLNSQERELREAIYSSRNTGYRASRLDDINYIILGNVIDLSEASRDSNDRSSLYLLSLFKFKINSLINRIISSNFSLTIGDYILNYLNDYNYNNIHLSGPLPTNRLASNSIYCGRIQNIDIQHFVEILNSNNFFIEYPSKLILIDIFDRIELYELYKTFYINTFIPTINRITTEIWEVDFARLESLSSIRYNKVVISEHDHLGLTMPPIRNFTTNPEYFNTFNNCVNNLLNSSNISRSIAENNTIVAKDKKVLKVTKEIKYDYKTGDIVDIKEKGKYLYFESYYTGIIVTDLSEVIQNKDTIINVQIKKEGIFEIIECKMGDIKDKRNNIIAKQKLAISCIIKGFEESGKLFGFARAKSRLVDSEVSIANVEHNYVCKLDKVKRDTVIINTNNNQYRFLTSDVEFILPSYQIVVPKKDRTVYEGSICKIINNKGLNLKKDAKVKVLSITSTTASKNSGILGGRALEQRKLDRVKFVDCETGKEHTTYLKKLKVI